jgi:hypothetical protein
MPGRAASWTRGSPNFAERKGRADARKFFCVRSTKSAPPHAGQPVACGDPRPDPARHEAQVLSLASEGERTMIALYDHIQELRAELKTCHLTRHERTQTEAELAKAIADQAELDRVFDDDFDAELTRGKAPAATIAP